MSVRTFSMADQRWFAEATGDFNPMHINPLAARRTQAGAPVVHGMHAALWMLETLIADGAVSAPIATLKLQFQKFVYVDAPAGLRILRQSDKALVAGLEVEGVMAVTLSAGFSPPTSAAAPPPRPAPLVDVEAPADLALADLHGRAGHLSDLADAPFAEAFPHAARAMGLPVVKTLAQLSALVGMVCPGLHSIFASLNVRVGAPNADPLSFQVETVDDRFRMAEINVAGGGVSGTVTAFARHPPIQQPSIADVAGRIDPAEFDGVTALVIGGSRGLGALTARMIVAGGGRVVVTYASGEAEARGLAQEIEAHAGPDRCHVLAYDARRPAATQLADLTWPIGQLYYFATTRIFRQKAAVFAARDFADFSQIYVDGFAEACAAAGPRAPDGLAVFYPSSVAVEEHPPEMTEYSMAKAAGEMLCADLTRFQPGLQVLVRRLPRILTDQTATVALAESRDAVEVMLPIVRELQSLVRPAPT
jgi:NAD(P)-dependent dehydrogenase (short-subunit alcohol dehydrogenase family)